MKIWKIAALAALAATLGGQRLAAQECEIPVSVMIMEQSEPIPQAAAEVFSNSLTRIAVNGGMNAELNFSQFIFSARMDVLDKTVLPGPPTQVMYNLGVTFYIADVYNKKKFSSAYIEVKGVGQNETKALINAFRQMGNQKAKLGQMLKDGKAKILDYYNTQYSNILKEAERAASLQNYEQAIALTVTIPACTRGGDQAIAAGLKYYNKARNRYCRQLLTQAQTLWAGNQTQEVAGEVAEILLQIDPEADCYSEALALAKEIKTQVRKDIDFEMREKYKDAVKLEEQRIAAIRAIGVAYGNGQQAQTTNLMWLR